MTTEILADKLIYYLATLALLGLTGLKLFNIMHKGEKYSFIGSIMGFVGGLVAYALALIMHLSMLTEKTIYLTWGLSVFSLYLFSLFFVIEVILLLYHVAAGKQRSRYNAGNVR